MSDYFQFIIIVYCKMHNRRDNNIFVDHKDIFIFGHNRRFEPSVNILQNTKAAPTASLLQIRCLGQRLSIVRAKKYGELYFLIVHDYNTYFAT